MTLAANNFSHPFVIRRQHTDEEHQLKSDGWRVMGYFLMNVAEDGRNIKLNGKYSVGHICNDLNWGADWPRLKRTFEYLGKIGFLKLQFREDGYLWGMRIMP